MKLYPFAYAAALLPLVAVHLCYLLAASYGHVPWCLPHLQSCASISQSGRLAPEFFVFKALMIPAAVLLLFYWLLCEQWLRALIGSRQMHWPLLLLAVVACAGLILYSVMLGAIGKEYQTLRRVGVTLFFGLSYIAQLIVSLRLMRWADKRTEYKRLSISLTALSLLILFIGLATVVIDAVDPEYYDNKVNAFEWSVTVLLCLHVLITGRYWQRTSVSGHITVDS